MKVLSPFNSAKNLMQILRELSLEEIREEAERPPRLLVMATSLEDADAVAETITGEFRSPYVTALRLDTPVDRLDAYDAAIIFDPEARPETKRLIDQLNRRSDAATIVTFMSMDPRDEHAAIDVRKRLVRQLPDRVPSLGRHLPAFVPVAVKEVIDDTSAANAQFALLANVPSVVPLFGTLATVSADFLVLTKNQLLLVYKIAAIHGRKLDNSADIMREMIPVAGAGFLWRTLAREAVTLMPLASGTVPKVAIAYSGTVAIGRAADYYYRFGEKPSKKLVASWFESGFESLKRRQFSFRDSKTMEAEFRVHDDQEDESPGRPSLN
jgi:uncharacterized protein (DUF697 family)